MGSAVGCAVGATVGTGRGRAEGRLVDGPSDGDDVGSDDTVGDDDGARSNRPVAASTQNTSRLGDTASSDNSIWSVCEDVSIVNDRPAAGASSNVNSIV